MLCNTRANALHCTAYGHPWPARVPFCTVAAKPPTPMPDTAAYGPRATAQTPGLLRHTMVYELSKCQ
eukprot:9353807-Pyramimonas_sp.AAC.1